MTEFDEKPVGYVGKEGKTSAPWWRSEKAARRMLSDAYMFFDDDVDVYELVSFFNDLAPQLRVKKSGQFYTQFVNAAKDVGMFDDDLHLLADELPVNHYRKLLWILEDYLTMIDAHAGDHRGDQVSNTMGIPPQWFIENDLNIVLNPMHWFKKGLATIITGENGAGKTNMMAWIMFMLSKLENPHGLQPVIATNVKFFGDWVKEYHIRIVRTISEIFDVVADIDRKGERRSLYCFIDEFDGAEGQNAWETHGKEAGAAFRVFNQMRKNQEIILVPAIHYPQDVNNRWRESLQGVHCILNKGKYYPGYGQKNQWSCVRYTDDLEVLKSVGIFWKGMPVNLQCIPDVSYSFETYAMTNFTFDYLPRDILQLMDIVDKIPLPQHGTEDERIDWLMQRGNAIHRFNTEWKKSKQAEQRRLLNSRQAKEYMQDLLEEAVELHESNMSLPEIHAHLLSEHEGDQFSSEIPRKFTTFSTAFYRYLKKMGGSE
jgi:hypothetical protein